MHAIDEHSLACDSLHCPLYDNNNASHIIIGSIGFSPNADLEGDQRRS